VWSPQSLGRLGQRRGSVNAAPGGGRDGVIVSGGVPALCDSLTSSAVAGNIYLHFRVSDKYESGNRKTESPVVLYLSANYMRKQNKITGHDCVMGIFASSRYGDLKRNMGCEADRLWLLRHDFLLTPINDA
jgi:hypothetical protein